MRKFLVRLVLLIMFFSYQTFVYGLSEDEAKQIGLEASKKRLSQAQSYFQNKQYEKVNRR